MTINLLFRPTPPLFIMKLWSDADHYGKGIKQVFDKLLERFMMAFKEGAELSDLTKLTAQIGYMAQVQVAILKNHEVDKQINEIKDLLARIPPETFQRAKNPMDPSILENDKLR